MLQIADYVQRAQELCAGKTLAELKAHWQQALALERVMEVLGEAVKRLPDELRQTHPKVPWRLVSGMRDKISHGYDSVDHEMLWDTVKNDLAGLLSVAEQMLKDLERDERK